MEEKVPTPFSSAMRQYLPLALKDCPQGHVPVVEDGALNFMRREIYARLVARGALLGQSVH